MEAISVLKAQLKNTNEKIAEHEKNYKQHMTSLLADQTKLRRAIAILEAGGSTPYKKEVVRQKAKAENTIPVRPKRRRSPAKDIMLAARMVLSSSSEEWLSPDEIMNRMDRELGVRSNSRTPVDSVRASLQGGLGKYFERKHVTKPGTKSVVSLWRLHPQTEKVEPNPSMH